MHSNIKAITFDLWDTVIINDSDEPKRKAQGQPSKSEERRSLVCDFLNRQSPIAQREVTLAYDVADAAFARVWHEQSVTWRVRDRIGVILKGLRRELPQTQMDRLVALHEEMELAVQPDIAAGIADAIRLLSRFYRLGIVSDTLFSPGRVLRELLKRYDLFQFFDSFLFSDEVGCSKPNPRLFQLAAEELKVKTTEIVHIGDREDRDIKGAHGAGAKAIYTTALLDRGSRTEAEATCSDYAQLPAIVDSLNTS